MIRLIVAAIALVIMSISGFAHAQPRKTSKSMNLELHSNPGFQDWLTAQGLAQNPDRSHRIWSRRRKRSLLGSESLSVSDIGSADSRAVRL